MAATTVTRTFLIFNKTSGVFRTTTLLSEARFYARHSQNYQVYLETVDCPVNVGDINRIRHQGV